MSYRLINANNITFNSDGFITADNIEKMPCIYADLPNGMDGEHYVLDQAIKALAQEPYEDAISRDELLKAIDTWDKFGCDADTKLVPYQDHYIPYIHYDDVVKCIKGMPPVNPQAKTGHWIRFKEFENGYYHIKCSECGQYWSIDGHAKIFRYCFNCGAKMAESEVEE